MHGTSMDPSPVSTPTANSSLISSSGWKRLKTVLTCIFWAYGILLAWLTYTSGVSTSASFLLLTALSLYLTAQTLVVLVLVVIYFLNLLARALSEHATFKDWVSSRFVSVPNIR